MTADIIAFPGPHARTPPPPVEDRPARIGDRVLILAEGRVATMIGVARRGGRTRAILLIDGATRSISPIRIAPIPDGAGPKGAA